MLARVRAAGRRGARLGHGARRTALLALLAASVPAQAGAASVQAGSEIPRRYELVQGPGAGGGRTAASPLPELADFTVEAVRAMLPAAYTGRSARVESIDGLYFLHTSNIMEMNRVWARRKGGVPRCIVLGQGSYSLEAVWRQIDDPSVLSRDEDGGYVLHRPVYIMPTGTLTVADGSTLRLSSTAGTFIYSNGTLIVADSEVVAWDTEKGVPARRKPVEKEAVLLYAHQDPRPYILVSEGSRTFLAGSTFRGLGYKGTSGTFGISFTPSVSGGRLAHHLERLAPPTGWMVGNRIVDLFFGFYSHRAEDVALVGNLFSGNVVYGIDPHDYSRRLIIARNVTQGSSFAHGIIFSRGVSDSWVVENLSVSNGGSGIMMDRSSTDNLIAGNLVLGNEGDGIAIFESDRNVLRGNTVLRNRRNGILVRNSADVEVLENVLSRNGRSGVEVASADISKLETRDFTLDPFRQRASAVVRGNTLHDNVRSAIALDAGTAITLHANRYPGSGPLYFDGDLAAHASALLAAEFGGTTPVTVRLVAPPGDAKTSEAGPASTANAIRQPNPLLEEHARAGAPIAMLGLARYYLRERDEERSWRKGIYWYGRAIRHARVSAMSELGVVLVGGVGRTAAERREGLVLLSMASQLGEPRARRDLELLPDVLGTSPSKLASARRQASQRLRARELWKEGVFSGVRIDLDRDELFEAERRVSRLLNERLAHEAARPPRLDRKRRSKKYEERVATKNARRARLDERLRRDRLADARAQGERRAHLDRVDRRERAAGLQSRTYTPDEWEAQRARVARILEAVNRHRSPQDPIRPDAIMLPTRVGADR